MVDANAVRRTAIAAAYAGAETLRAKFGNLLQVEKKGLIDLVTEADRLSEKRILEVIRSRFPDHGILAEESGRKDGHPDFTWIVDPLDGTTNYAHQIGLYAVSIAFAARGAISVGIILNPVSGELFAATAGQGATLNGRAIGVSEATSLQESLLVTGFPYDVGDRLPETLQRFGACLAAAQGIRRLGSAALDLCYVACGRFEGFWEEHLQPWDTAAGVLIAREAGAAVSEFSGQPYTLESPSILATNGRIHARMIELLRGDPP
jgi:myo-inositol-1(or 4)-monophosphatase